jgi:hypothetical protein
VEMSFIKRFVAKLLGQVEFDPVDAGALKIDRYAEPFGTLATEFSCVAMMARNGFITLGD